MASYVLLGKAAADVEAIAESSLRRCGLARAERYVRGLHERLRTLAELPDLGRDASGIRAGYRRIDTASHSVFYRKTGDGVLIMRILHQQMDFGRRR